MNNLKIDNRSVTLVDQVEDKLLSYLKSKDEEGYRKALEEHFEVYRIFLSRKEHQFDIMSFWC
ncbi:MAG: hypothetical protein ACOX19_02325 [Fermentimonas sp.]|jgi:hypothetical protein